MLYLILFCIFSFFKLKQLFFNHFFNARRPFFKRKGPFPLTNFLFLLFLLFKFNFFYYLYSKFEIEMLLFFFFFFFAISNFNYWQLLHHVQYFNLKYWIVPHLNSHLPTWLNDRKVYDAMLLAKRWRNIMILWHICCICLIYISLCMGLIWSLWEVTEPFVLSSHRLLIVCIHRESHSFSLLVPHN